MRSTNDIIISVMENEKPEYEELRMVCLVLNSLLFFSHQNIARAIWTNWTKTEERTMAE